MIKKIPFEYIAATGYLIGNLTLTFKGVIFDNRSIFPSLDSLLTLDPITYQTLSGITFIIISLLLLSFIHKGMGTLEMCVKIAEAMY